MRKHYAIRFCILLKLLILSSAQLFSQTMTDIDGNVYQTVKIGNQTWMKENLKVTHYRNGDPIPEVQDSLVWVTLKYGAWCNNENSAQNGNIYGKLYNWNVIRDPRGIAPKGWHVPTDEEWKTLEIFLGMPPATANLKDYRGTTEANSLKLKDTTTYWTLACCPAPGLQKNKGTNSSGFSALGGGYRLYFNAGGNYTSFQRPTGNAQFWTSTALPDSTAWLRHLCVYHEDIYRSNWSIRNGSSIRLVQDAPTDIRSALPDETEVYPNPANNELFVKSASLQPLVFQIFTPAGKLVSESVLTQEINRLEIGYLSAGFYLIKVSSPVGSRQLKLYKNL